MMKATIHRIGKIRFIRLPAALAFAPAVKQVDITCTGQTLTIAPPGRPWDAFFDAPGVSSDFLTHRTQDPRPT